MNENTLPRKQWALLFTLATAVTLSGGCANQHAVYRQFDASSSAPESLVLDVKERVVLAKASDTGNKFCTEPSPDALSVVGTSLSGSASDQKADLTLKAAAGNSETGAFVGLRTTAIQLLQYEMYRNCESEINGDLDGEVADLHRRDQNVMTGLLAIEQLTGAVTTRPVTVSQNSDAGTGGDTSKEEDRLSDKQKTLAADQTKLTEAKQHVADQKKITDDDAQAVQTATTALKNATAADQADKKADLDSKTAKQTTDLATAKTYQSDLDNATAIVKSDTEAVKNAQSALTAAQLNVRASTSGDSKIAEAINTNKLDSASVQVVATAVKEIVHEIVSTSFSEESCFQYLKDVSQGAAQPVADMTNYCNAVLHQGAASLLARAEKDKTLKLSAELKNAELSTKLRALSPQ